MKPSTRRACLALAGTLLLASCAREIGESYDDFERMALEAWIAQHRPDLAGNLQEEGGYYVDVLDAGDPDRSPVGEEACWVHYDFSGRDLGGNIVLTREASEAVQEGTFTRYTRYVPLYRYCSDEGYRGTGLLEGTYLAMRNTLVLSEAYFEKYRSDASRRLTSRRVQLREGSRVVLYMPSRVVGGSGVEGTGGYEGQYSLDARRPLIATIGIRDTVKNPLQVEGDDVDAFCTDNGGLRVYLKPEADGTGAAAPRADVPESSIPSDPSSPDHPYNVAERWVSASDTIPQLYINYDYRPSERLTFSDPYAVGYEPYKTGASMADIDRRIAEALEERFHADGALYPGVKGLQSDSVKFEGKAKIWYIGRFLDGFVFDTNIDEVKRIVYGEVVKAGEALEYTPETNRGSLISAYYYVVPHLKFGQWAAFVTTSTNAYGSSGRSGTTSTSSSGGSSSSNYLDYLNYMNYMNSYYGSGGYYNNYYGNYYGNYFGGAYNPYYGSSYNSSSEGTTTTRTVYTEIPAFAPLVFQLYIEPEE